MRRSAPLRWCAASPAAFAGASNRSACGGKRGGRSPRNICGERPSESLFLADLRGRDVASPEKNRALQGLRPAANGEARGISPSICRHEAIQCFAVGNGYSVERKNRVSGGDTGAVGRRPLLHVDDGKRRG